MSQEKPPAVSPPEEKRATTFLMILRVLMCMTLAAAVGGAASKLTVGMILARHFRSDQHLWLHHVWMTCCILAGALVGFCYRPSWLFKELRPISWGAVLALTALAILTRIPFSLSVEARQWGVLVPGISVRIGLEEAGLLSAPAVLLLGGILGWFFHRRFGPKVSQTDAGDPATASTAQ